MNEFLQFAFLLMKQRGIQLQDERAKTVHPVPPAAVMAALVNPIKNSLEVMLADGLLALLTSSTKQSGVEDNEPGIPREFMPRLFEPFAAFRHAGSPDGLGLGMPMVRHVLDVLGGSISVASIENDRSGICMRIISPASVPVRGVKR